MMVILQYIIQILLIAIFLMASTGKLKGSDMHKASFKKWGMPQSFRILTGTVELLAAILLIVGFWSQSSLIIGALLLVAVGIGGVLTHIKAKDTFKDTSMILILGILAIVLFAIAL
ncbi:DoxX family protein [Staphylococcus equorum]|uniref:DoxX family protein n=1 Tax=Staphylococcus equorum TaxID=246432 RepID=UPI001F546FC7|nr:DoxX family protein [Staphylococcus equorum]